MVLETAALALTLTAPTAPVGPVSAYALRPVALIGAPPTASMSPSLSLAPSILPTAFAPVVPAASKPERPDALGQLRRVLVDWVKRDAVGDAAVPVSASRPGVTAFVLDLDGNAFGPGMPTKIVLFKKGGNEELLVSTYDFARLEKKLGTDSEFQGVNLKDYELRGPLSFREFMGDKFRKDLEWAIDHLPPSLWQGPSWDAMVRALSDERTAPYVYVLTARQHPPEALLDGFRLLQERGYIRFLPKLEHLHGVGGTYRTAARKAELMAEILDVIERTPETAEGGRPAAGFSDDTWANYEKMRDALLADIRARPGRWTRTKIVLFYTGQGDGHAPEAVVLNADGTTRPYVPGEPR